MSSSNNIAIAIATASINNNPGANSPPSPKPGPDRPPPKPNSPTDPSKPPGSGSPGTGSGPNPNPGSGPNLNPYSGPPTNSGPNLSPNANPPSDPLSGPPSGARSSLTSDFRHNNLSLPAKLNTESIPISDMQKYNPPELIRSGKVNISSEKLGANLPKTPFDSLTDKYAQNTEFIGEPPLIFNQLYAFHTGAMNYHLGKSKKRASLFPVFIFRLLTRLPGLVIPHLVGIFTI